MGGVSIVVFGLIAVPAPRSGSTTKVDFSQNKNLIVAAITLVLGNGDSRSSSAYRAGRHRRPLPLGAIPLYVC